jgi:HEAT repeat protein
MLDEVKYAVLLGGMVDLLRRFPDATRETKATLRSLVTLAAQGSASVRLGSSGLTVEGVPVPDDTPFVGMLVGQMRIHGVAAIIIAHRASALDFMQLLRPLARDPVRAGNAAELERELRGAHVASIVLVSTETDRASHEMRVSDALEATGELAQQGEIAEGFEPTAADATYSDGATFQEMLREMPVRSGTLSESVNRLREVPAGSSLVTELGKIESNILQALRDEEIEQVIEALVGLVNLEEETSSEEDRNTYGIALRRILYYETIRQIARYLMDEVFQADLLKVVRRAGAPASKALMDLLVEAPTFAERKAYLAALRLIEEGGDAVASMLRHPEWFVVRNAADLVGELRFQEAVPDLGDTMDHADARVRRAAAAALAKIGTADAVRHLRRALKDPDGEVRVAVAQGVAGRGLGPLTMSLVKAAEEEKDPQVSCEYYRALGRIGTPDAVQALANAVNAGGLLKKRRAPAQRVAATEALALAGGNAARDVLLSLRKDRNRDVREAARKGLGSR